MEKNTNDRPGNLSAILIHAEGYEPPQVKFMELTIENGFAASTQTDSWLHDEWI